ncbi:hypothetical protein AURDEDRAFT_115080 [Auricularia subglabra TFB-10046 SS5]|nr:hypothetical protein AURDEDRAFT_115080 [Auricularia subglabra TFB-10046 SS5]
MYGLGQRIALNGAGRLFARFAREGRNSSPIPLPVPVPAGRRSGAMISFPTLAALAAPLSSCYARPNSPAGLTVPVVYRYLPLSLQ